MMENNTEVWIFNFLNEHLKERDINNVNDITPEDLKTVSEYLKNDPKITAKQTPMMKVIDHHAKILTWKNRIKQLNLDLGISDETNLKKYRLPFKRVLILSETLMIFLGFPLH